MVCEPGHFYAIRLRPDARSCGHTGPHSNAPNFALIETPHFLVSASQFITSVRGEGVWVTKSNIRKRPSRLTS
jgi:hypothetical protein